MTDIVRDAIAAELALVARVAPAPTDPLGYGTDISCASDVSPTMATVDPFSTRAIGEALARRYDTPRGSLPGAPDYGLDLRSYLNRGTTAADMRALEDRLRTEGQKDDRIRSLDVRATPSPTGSRLTVDVRVVPVDPRLGTFRLTLAVTSAEILIEALR